MNSRPVRPRPAWLRALGKSGPPTEIVISGRGYRRVEVFKHDSWAATARYRNADDEVVCKFNRVQSIGGVPMAWLGRWLARREAKALQRLADVSGIPVECGPVIDQGRHCRHAVAHVYVPGHPLGYDEQVGPDFFPALVNLLHNVHGRDIAYVDLHKRENILVGESGQPHLVDFQVCVVGWRPHWKFCLLPILRAWQRADWYHLAKHITRHRPDQMDLLQSVGGGRRPVWIRMHRLVAVPLRRLRRQLLTALNVRGAGGRATSEDFPEDAVRRERSGLVGAGFPACPGN